MGNNNSNGPSIVNDFENIACCGRSKKGTKSFLQLLEDSDDSLIWQAQSWMGLEGQTRGRRATLPDGEGMAFPFDPSNTFGPSSTDSSTGEQTSLNVLYDGMVPTALPKGIIHFIGTGGLSDSSGNSGGGKWQNPAESGEIFVTRSSSGDQGPASDAVGDRGRCSSTNKSKSEQWWQIDLGKARKCCISAYALRHGDVDPNTSLRHWQLQASNDCKSWTALMQHGQHRGHGNACGDGALDAAFGAAAWQVLGCPDYFQYFRIVDTTSLVGRPIHLSGFELYGRASSA